MKYIIEIDSESQCLLHSLISKIAVWKGFTSGFMETAGYSLLKPSDVLFGSNGSCIGDAVDSTDTNQNLFEKYPTCLSILNGTID